MQENLINYLKKKKIPHRVMANNKVKCSEKWINKLHEIAFGLVNNYFKEVYYVEFPKKNEYVKFVKFMSLRNIPFFTYIVDDRYFVLTDTIDFERVIKFTLSSSKMQTKMSTEV